MTTANGHLTTTAQLLRDRHVQPDAVASLESVVERYALAIPPAMRALIDPSDPNDPIARQFVPDARELITKAEERLDPIGDHAHAPVPGIVHRYRNRALLKIVSTCPVYCRFCFRREMVGPKHGGTLDPADLDGALHYVAAHPELEEVIVTGGDPLILSPRRLADLTRRLAAIGHVSKIRWHTRVPVVAPEMVTEERVRALRTDNAFVRVAVHTNHARELTAQALAACHSLTSNGIRLLSQTVLLRGVNDSAATLANLMQRCESAGIAPYYLHHGDLAPGTAHFRTSITRGQEIWNALCRRLPPDLVPTYVLDIPGGYGKVPLDSDHVQSLGDGSYAITDPYGQVHTYRDCLASEDPTTPQRPPALCVPASG